MTVSPMARRAAEVRDDPSHPLVVLPFKGLHAEASRRVPQLHRAVARRLPGRCHFSGTSKELFGRSQRELMNHDDASQRFALK